MTRDGKGLLPAMSKSEPNIDATFAALRPRIALDQGEAGGAEADRSSALNAEFAEHAEGAEKTFGVSARGGSARPGNMMPKRHLATSGAMPSHSSVRP
jgi:hypothetical protein